MKDEGGSRTSKGKELLASAAFVFRLSSLARRLSLLLAAGASALLGIVPGSPDAGLDARLYVTRFGTGKVPDASQEGEQPVALDQP